MIVSYVYPAVISDETEPCGKYYNFYKRQEERKLIYGVIYLRS